MEKLQLLTFKNIVDPLYNEKVSYIYFPIEWLEIVEIHYRTFLLTSKLKLVNERLYDMFSDILFIQHNPYILKEDTPWIVAKEPMSQEQLDYIFQSWYEVIHDWKPNKLIDPPHLEWQYDLISNLPVLHDKKTFSKWVPALITHIFCEQPLLMKNKNDEEVYFSPLRSQHVSEAMSEPIKDDETQDYFAYVYRFEYITRGGENIPLLKVSVGIRRFYQQYNHKDISILLGRKRSQILISTPEFESNKKKQRFVKLKVQQAEKGIKWIKRFRNLKDEYRIGGEVKLEHILQCPKEYIRGTNKRVLLPYNENIYKVQGTKIKLGIKVREKKELLNEFQLTFPYFTLIPECENVITNNENELLHLLTPKGLDSITLEVWSDDIVIEIEQALLDSKIVLAQNGDSSYVLNADNPVLLKIVRYNIEKVLQNPYRMQYSHKNKKKLVDDVVKAVHATAGEQNEMKLALIALKTFNGREKINPKQIIREGFVRTQRISAFINLFIGQSVSKKEIITAILSLLEQNRFLKRSWNKIKLPGIIVNLSVEKMSKYDFLPIFSKINGREIVYKLYGQEEWGTIDHTLLNIGNNKVFLPQPSKRNDIGAHFKQFLSETLVEILQDAHKQNKEVYFVVDANMRKHWIKELHNESVNIEVSPEIISNFKKDIKIIRINTNSDVPNYIVRDQKYVMDETSLFVDQLGIYYSTAAYELNCNEIAQQCILEIIPFGVKFEEREELAKMIHYMCCKSTLLSEQNIHNTYIMHMVKLIKNYTTDIDSREFKEFDDELDEDVIIMEKEDGLILI
ncbi:translation initiation inhibitor [Bacillus cereus]|nr:translation initiation inhibitor [Bacillus cereus]PFM35836.1 translation initiation inhibitor [Bacillus cereus]PFP93760.1 translation initiation inhibitor [Bacillus cereus]